MFTQNVAVSVAGALMFAILPVLAEQSTLEPVTITDRELQARVIRLENEIAELKRIIAEIRATPQTPVEGPSAVSAATQDNIASNTGQSPTLQAPDRLTDTDRATLDFLRDATINFNIDAYYGWNFNRPVGGVNLLRAYDVTSNLFSLNQADIVSEWVPDIASGRRFGGRLDLQWGQATETLQGNPSSEPRPQIYRNIFQAYGTYAFPLGKGLTADFGKWGSSLGLEGNYTKDQINYSRSYYFYYLPFYHMGLRASYKVNDSMAVNYWVVNGINHVEKTNGFKDQMFGFNAKPRSSINWTVNYYFGQENPDRVLSAPTNPVPVQPGLTFTAIRPAPDGRTHIFDTYATWQATSALTAALEGDYVIQRLWRHEAPGRSSAPSWVAGGAGYLRYQLTPKFALAARAEYMSDPAGLFSGISQALKETTATLNYKVGNGFLTWYEWRRDFSNQPTFLTSAQGVLSKHQTTATIGLTWWWGRKEGAW